MYAPNLPQGGRGDIPEGYEFPGHDDFTFEEPDSSDEIENNQDHFGVVLMFKLVHFLSVI